MALSYFPESGGVAGAFLGSAAWKWKRSHLGFALIFLIIVLENFTFRVWLCGVLSNILFVLQCFGGHLILIEFILKNKFYFCCFELATPLVFISFYQIILSQKNMFQKWFQIQSKDQLGNTFACGAFWKWTIELH